MMATRMFACSSFWMPDDVGFLNGAPRHITAPLMFWHDDGRRYTTLRRTISADRPPGWYAVPAPRSETPLRISLCPANRRPTCAPSDPPPQDHRHDDALHPHGHQPPASGHGQFWGQGRHKTRHNRDGIFQQSQCRLSGKCLTNRTISAEWRGWIRTNVGVRQSGVRFHHPRPSPPPPQQSPDSGTHPGAVHWKE
jgi:hypothetical protein